MRSIFDRANLACIVVLYFGFACLVYGDPVDDYVRTRMQEQHIAGMAVAVVKHGRVLKKQTYGYANLELKASVSSKSVFKIGSISKQIIATGVLLLEAQGKLKLTDSISSYLRDAPAAWQEIEIRHLLSHTSGLVREAPGFDPLKSLSDLEIIRSAYGIPLQSPPGEQFLYSNLGYFVLAEIISAVSHEPWPSFVENHVFVPLNLQTIQLANSAEVVPERASGYTFATGKQKNAVIQLALRPSGAFMSSLDDMLTWNAAMDSGKLLPIEAQQQMWTPFLLKGQRSAGYGYGWYIETVNGHRLNRHGGSMPGFRSEISRFADDDVTVIVLTNAELSRTDAIAIGIANHFIEGLAPKREYLKLPTSQLQTYSGNYKTDTGEMISISSSEPVIDAIIPRSGPPISFRPYSPDVFYSEDDLRLSLVFKRDADGRIESVAVKSDDIARVEGKRTQ